MTTPNLGATGGAGTTDQPDPTDHVGAAVRAAATGRLRDPADATRLLDLAALVDDAGNVDPAAVGAALDELLDAKPYLGAPVQTVGDGDRFLRHLPVLDHVEPGEQFLADIAGVPDHGLVAGIMGPDNAAPPSSPPRAPLGVRPGPTVNTAEVELRHLLGQARAQDGGWVTVGLP